MEHEYGGIYETLSCLNALAASQTPGFIRLLECSAMWAKKALDLRNPIQKAEDAVLGMKPKGEKRVYLDVFAMPHEEPSELKKRGYHMICGTVDILLYRDAAVKDVLKFKTVI